jgi:hypothetical protein
MCENGVLRRTFALKWEEVTGEWRKLYSDELHSLYSSLDIQLEWRMKKFVQNFSQEG